QRVGTGHRVIVNLGNASLVDGGGGIEFARDNLAADAVGGFKNGDAAKFAQFLLEIPRAHQAARPSANNCKIQHMFPFVSGPRSAPSPAAPGPALSRFRRSDCFPEGKMNKK